MRNLTMTSALLATLVSTAALAAANTDCYLQAQPLKLVHGCIYTEGDGPGACQEWMNDGNARSLYVPLSRTSLNHYQIANSEFQVGASVVFDGRAHAKISVQAPSVNHTEIVGITHETSLPTIPESRASAQHVSYSTLKGMSYSISCSFGLSDLVDANQAAEEAEMNQLGPAPEWSDAKAPSVATLPIGSTLELTQDIEVVPGTDMARTVFVEQNGLMTEAGFDDLKLPFRFAFAEFFNSNNGYMANARYPKGLKMQVTKVEMTSFTSGGQEYEITLKTIAVPTSYHETLEPIVHLKVTGRRSGRADIKIPQLAALLQPIMRLSVISR